MSAFFRRTPVVSSASDVGVVFKLECLQSSGSFKDRGIGHMIASLRERDDVARLVCSSGGNAGLAVATVAERLNLPATIFVPLTTLPLMITKIRARGATVIVGGANWNEADVEARKLVTSDADGRTLYVPPFDHELIFEGNSTIVDELVDEFGVDAMPDVIVCSVGGGGLLRGIQLGLARHKLESRVRIIACETNGAASFAAAKAAGHSVRIDKIETIASTLGALAVTTAVLDNRGIDVQSHLMSDSDAVRACLRFLDEQRILVEPACGAALAAVYDRENARISYAERVCVIVCGGSAVSLDLLQGWRDRFRVVS